MSITLLGSPLWKPSEYEKWSDSTPQLNTSSLLMDASGEEVGFMLPVPKTGTISALRFRTGTVTSSQSLNIGLYTLDSTTGMPNTASPYGGMTVGTQASVATNTGYRVALGTGAAATLGDIIGIDFSYTSTAGNLVIAAMGASLGFAHIFPVCALKAGAGPTWAKVNSLVPLVGIEYSDGSYYYIDDVFPITSVTNATGASNNANRRLGIKFQVTAPLRLSHFGWYAAIGAGADFNATLYDANDTVLSSNAYTANSVRANTTTTAAMTLPLDNPYELQANTTYRFTVNSTTANSIQFYYMTALDQSALPQITGSANWYLTTYNGTVWSDTTSASPFMWLGFDGVNVGTGSTPYAVGS